MKSYLKIAVLTLILSLLPLKAVAQDESPTDQVLKRAATEVIAKYINEVKGLGYTFRSVTLPQSAIIYKGEEEMMQMTGASVPGMIQRQIVKFGVLTDSNLRGEVACDVDFRQIEKGQLWVFFYGCKYSNERVQADWESGNSYVAKMPIRTLWNYVDLTPQEQTLFN